MAFALFANTPAAAQQSTDATLSALTASSSTSAAGTFSALTLSPSTFAAATVEYSALVANSISHVKLTPTVNESNATVKVGKSAPLTAVSSGTDSAAIALTAGANAITVEVTAQDTTTTKTYMVRITRQDANGQPIWAATLTVGELSSVLFGCTDSQPAIRCTDTARLTDNTINLNSATHNVISIVIAGTDLEFALNPEPSAALREYSLHVGGDMFPLHTDTGATATWDITQTWSAGQVLPVTLQRSAAVAPGGAPTELLLEQNPGKLIATWTAPTDTGSRVLSGYDVQYKLTSATDQTAITAGDPSTGWVDAPHTGTTASGEITGLTDDTSHNVRVRAVNEEGGGPWVTGTATPGRTLWSDTLTVADLGSKGLGCTGGLVDLTCSAGNNGLTDSRVVIDGGALTIFAVELNNGNLKLLFVAAPSTKLKLYSLHVGTTALALSSATITGREAVWSNTGLTWTAGNTVSVSLRLPQSVTLPDPPSVSLSAVPSTVAEGQSVTVTATLSAALNADVVIPITLTAGSGTDSSDYGTLSSITIPSGQTSASDTITTVRDADVGTKTFTVSLGTLPATVTAGSPNSVTITITDAGTGTPTTPTVSLSVDPQRVREGDSVTVTLTLSPPLTTGDASIPITLTADSGIETGDYGTLSSITIPSGQTTGTGTITTSNDNDNTDGTFTVAIGTPLPTGVSLGSPSSRLVTIDDKDPSTLTLFADTQRTLQVSPGDTAMITAELDKPALANTEVMLTYTLSPTGSYTLTPAPITLTITSGNTTSTGGAAFTVGEDVPIGTTITLTAVDPMSGNYSLTADPLVIEVVSPLQAEQLHRTALPEVARAVAGRVTGAISTRVGQVLNGGGGTTASANLGGQSSLAGALQTHAPGLINENRPLRDLLHGSRFVLPFHRGGGGDDGSPAMSLWGSGEYRNLSGENDGLEFDGTLHGAQIGVDSKLRENLLAGVALSWSQGEFEYEDTGEGGGQGDYEIDLQALHPYLGWRTAQLSWWATAGYGSGEVEITPEGSTTTASDVNLRSIGTGGSGLLWSNADNTASVRLKGEFTQTEMEVERSEQTAALTVDATLMRLAAEASRTRNLTNGGHLHPTLSLGMRHDGGDGNTGAGAEITTGVRYTNPQTGITASATAHALLGRNDYEEWGIQATLRNSPGADGQGLSFVMSPGYGNGGGNTGQIWSNGLRGEASPANHDPSGRLEIRLGYGLSSPGERNGLLTPWSGLTLQENGKLYRLGLDWASDGPFPFTLRLSGERRENENADADHAVLLKGETRF